MGGENWHSNFAKKEVELLKRLNVMCNRAMDGGLGLANIIFILKMLTSIFEFYCFGGHPGETKFVSGHAVFQKGEFIKYLERFFVNNEKELEQVRKKIENEERAEKREEERKHIIPTDSPLG